MKNYELYIFDIDNTLIDYDRIEKEALGIIYNKYFKDIKKELFHNTFKKINDELWACYTRDRKLELEELRYSRFETLSYKLNHTYTTQMVSEYEYLLGNNVHLFPGVLSVLSLLKSKNKKMAIVSNGIESIQYRKLEKAKIINYFDKIVISEMYSVRKPDREIYEVVLNDLKIKPDNCIIIGDSLTSDYMGAKNLGSDFCYINKDKKTNSKSRFMRKGKIDSPQIIMEISSVSELKDLLIT